MYSNPFSGALGTYPLFQSPIQLMNTEGTYFPRAEEVPNISHALREAFGIEKEIGPVRECASWRIKTRGHAIGS